MKYALTEFFRRYRQGIIFFEQLLFIPTMVMMLATGLQYFVRFFYWLSWCRSALYGYSFL